MQEEGCIERGHLAFSEDGFPVFTESGATAESLGVSSCQCQVVHTLPHDLGI